LKRLTGAQEDRKVFSLKKTSPMIPWKTSSYALPEKSCEDEIIIRNETSTNIRHQPRLALNVSLKRDAPNQKGPIT